MLKQEMIYPNVEQKGLLRRYNNSANATRCSLEHLNVINLTGDGFGVGNGVGIRVGRRDRVGSYRYRGTEGKRRRQLSSCRNV